MATVFGKFTTLNDFGAVVANTKATDAQAASLSLVTALTKAVKLIQSTHRNGKKVVFVGNGGSAAIASHQATDLWKNGNIRSMAFNDASFLTCAANDYGYDQVFAQPILRFCDEGDLLIAISSSGQSANILNAIDAARSRLCSVISYSGFKMSNPLRRCGDLNFYLDSNSYGVVEVGHLLLIHSVIDEVIRLNKEVTKHGWKDREEAVF